jgi:4-diphosphocytidyl-2-C-methyl-D-erythritol kinase
MDALPPVAGEVEDFPLRPVRARGGLRAPSPARTASMPTANAPAKINLCLDILCRREDGFHEIATLFSEVGVADALHAEAAAEDSLSVDGPFAEGVPTDAGNLVLRAVAALRSELGICAPGVAIRLTKNLPHGAGLGGGSSDAAAALRLANGLWGSPATPEVLAAVAARIGSDCAFFVRGGAAVGRGRGEILEPVALRRRADIVLVKPPAGVPTREAYAALSPERDFGERSALAALAAWAADAGPWPREVHNAFQRSVAERVPEVGTALDLLRARGARFAMLCGSGSACFGIFATAVEAASAAESIRGATGWWAVATTPGAP